ncbi:MAG: hypothetical protein AAF203_08690 [Pseudomonadota bacterium]
MNRRLNPELFNNKGPSEPPVNDYSAVRFRDLEKELKSSKKRISHLESMIEVLQSQFSMLSENSDKRTDVFSKALSQLEGEIREQGLKNSKQFQRMESRLKDQGVVEGQIESLVERFNMNLMQFENKLASLKNVLSEKEMTLMTYRSVMEKIVDEVEKLKKQNRGPRFPVDHL